MPAPITTTTMAALSEYSANPAMAADPTTEPNNGTAQHATQAIPVVNAMRALSEARDLEVVATMRSLSNSGACTLNPGVRSTVKLFRLQTPNPSFKRTRLRRSA